MKHTFKRSLALLLVLVMVAGLLPSALADDVAAVNVAQGAAVTATSSFDGGGLYSPSYLTDGLLGNYPAEKHLGWNTGEEASATITLDKTYKLSKIELYPITFESGKFFPSAYTVSVSADGESWTKVGGAENVPAPGTTAQTVSFDETAAKYIKIDVTPRSVLEANGTTSVMAQIAEVCAYGAADSGESGEQEAVNVARGKFASATDSVDGGGLYAPSMLTDGIFGNYNGGDRALGWCTGTEASATIRLGATCRISSVKLYPVTFETGKFFPASYVVSISMDGKTWTEVGRDDDVTDEEAKTAQTVTFDEAKATYVKIDVTPRHVTEADGVTVSVYAQISEVEVYGVELPKEEPKPVNVATNQKVTATKSVSGGGLYAPEYLVDGLLGNYPAEQHLGWNTAEEASATIELDKEYRLSSVELCPVAYESGKFFPSAYTVFVSANGKDWTKVGGAEDVPAPGTTAQTVKFAETIAKYVKIDVTPRHVTEADGTTVSVYAQISEVRIFGLKVLTSTTMGLHDYDLPGYLNLALHKEATSSDNCAHDGCAAANVTDGKLEDTADLGWDTYGSNGIAWLQVDLAGICDISRVVVYPFWSPENVNLGDWVSNGVGGQFPAEYELQVSVDGKEFTTIDTFTHPDPAGRMTGAVIHDFAETKARYVRINVTQPGSDFFAFGTTRPHSRIGEINVYGFSRDLTIYDPYKPSDIYNNLALGKRAVSDNDYAEYGMAAANTTDGKLQTADTYGWSTRPGTDGTGNLTVDLGSEAALNRFVVYPFYIGTDVGVFFPKGYEIQVSSDNESFKTVASMTENENVVRPQIIDLDKAVSGRYVRLHVTESGYLESQGNIAQIGEISAYGIYNSNAAVINKTALRMNPGDEDYLKFTYYGAGNLNLTFRSENTSVATISPEGKVVAVAEGSTKLVVDDAATGGHWEVSVLVDNYKPTENLMITAFWPIQKANMTKEYLDDMKEAGITNIQMNFTLDTANYEDNMTIAQMAYERGMGITVSEKAWGWGRISSFTDEQIYEEALKYSHVPGVIGYYVIDEPPYAGDFAHCFAPIKKAMPSADVHLNFVPNVANYRSLLDKIGSDLDYLMFDAYIWPAGSGCNEAALFGQSNTCREIALEYGVKSAQFIQACSYGPGVRKPNGNEIRYNVNAALAYGNKQIAYFYYRTPEVESLEIYSPGIVDGDGKRAEIFDDVAAINASALKLGPTLMSVEALGVYHMGRDSGVNNPLPADFYLQPAEGSNLIISYMRNNTTKQNYVMLVNRDYENAADVTFTVADSIHSLQYVSDQTGELVELTGNGQTYTCNLVAGGCILLKMPESVDYTPNWGVFEETPAGENSAFDAKTSSANSVLADGARIHDSGAKAPNLWTAKASAESPAVVAYTYKGEQEVNRVDLYPNEADKFPSDFTIEVTTDGTTWTPVVEKTGFTLESDTGVSFRFDSVKVRGIRLVISAPASIQLVEFETYNDNGTVPAPAPKTAYPYDAALTPSDNLARNASIIYSSVHPQGEPYWRPEHINDGFGYDVIGSRSNAGWSSLFPSGHNAAVPEWIGYDLGALKTISKAIVFNAWQSLAECFPCDYEIQVSNDAETWTTVFAVQNDTNFTKVGARVMKFEPVNARYVRFVGTRQSGISEGFGMQLSELEIYGTDFTAANKEALTAAIAEAEALEGTKYTDASWQALQSALTAAKQVGADEAATQEAVDAATEALKAAIAALEEKPVVPSVNKDALTAAIDKAEKLDSSKYTDASWDALLRVLASAKQVEADEAATQEAVNAAEQALNAAMAALVKKDDSKPVIPPAVPSAPGRHDTFLGTFDDVKKQNWYYDAVKFVYNADLFKGTSENLFAPNALMTRGMLVTVLYRLEGRPVISADTGFTDVDSGAYYAKAVAWAKANGIVNGITSTTFAPNGSITREQIAAILYRYANYKKYDTTARISLNAYTDAGQISNYAREAMSWAVAAGLVNGRTVSTLVPQGTATRAEVATLLMRLAGEYGE